MAKRGRPKSVDKKKSEAAKKMWAKRRKTSKPRTKTKVQTSAVEDLNGEVVALFTNATVAIDQKGKVHLIAA